MYFVYILQSFKDNKKYIGFTNNIERRLQEHNSGKIKSTKHRTPFKLIHIEKFSTKEEALNRELYIKSRKGKLDFLLNYPSIK